MENDTKLHEKLSNAAGVEINHLIIMQWFNHILVLYNYCKCTVGKVFSFS